MQSTRRGTGPILRPRRVGPTKRAFPAPWSKGARPSAEARAPVDDVGQALPLLRLERIVDLRHQTDERLPRAFDDRVGSRELLAEEHAIEGLPPKGVHDFLPA